MCRNCHYFCIVHFKVCRFPHGCADMQRWTYLSSRLNKLFQFWIFRLIQSLSIKHNIHFSAQNKNLKEFSSCKTTIWAWALKFGQRYTITLVSNWVSSNKSQVQKISWHETQCSMSCMLVIIILGLVAMLENMLINYAGKVIKSLTTTNSHEKMNEVPQRAPFDTIPASLSSSSQESRKWRKRWLVIVHSGVLTTNRVHPLWAINRGIMIAQQALAHNGDSSFKATNYSKAVGWFLFWKFHDIICFLNFSFQF